MKRKKIPRNPEEAGNCKASEYRRSGNAPYGDRKSFSDTGSPEELIGDQAAYEARTAEENEDECPESVPPKRGDERALKGVRKQLKGKSGTALRDTDREERDGALRKLKKAGPTIRQLGRLTGINRGTVQKAS